MEAWGGGASSCVINTLCTENGVGFLTTVLEKVYCSCRLAGVRTSISAWESHFTLLSPFGVERAAAVFLFQVPPACQPAGKTTGQCNPTNKHFIVADRKQICLCLVVIHWSVTMGRHVPGESEKLCLRYLAGELVRVRVTGENALAALLLCEFLSSFSTKFPNVFRHRDMDESMEWARLFCHPSSLTFFGLRAQSGIRIGKGQSTHLWD